MNKIIKKLLNMWKVLLPPDGVVCGEVADSCDFFSSVSPEKSEKGML